jgi:biopolymer transport protein ExbD
MKKSFLKKKQLPQEMALQITSMADIFTIILVFLLKSYSTSVSNVSPTEKTRLPVAQSEVSVKDALKLEISSNSILIDQKPIVKLNNFEFSPGEVPDHGKFGPLYRVLFEQRKKLPNANADSNLLVLADEKTPYQTLQKVLASAGSAGFVDLQLVVIQPQ